MRGSTASDRQPTTASSDTSDRQPAVAVAGDAGGFRWPPEAAGDTGELGVADKWLTLMAHQLTKGYLQIGSIKPVSSLNVSTLALSQLTFLQNHYYCYSKGFF